MTERRGIATGCRRLAMMPRMEKNAKGSWWILVALVCVSEIAALKVEILERSRIALSWLQILQSKLETQLFDAEAAELKERIGWKTKVGAGPR